MEKIRCESMGSRVFWKVLQLWAKTPLLICGMRGLHAWHIAQIHHFVAISMGKMMNHKMLGALLSGQPVKKKKWNHWLSEPVQARLQPSVYFTAGINWQASGQHEKRGRHSLDWKSQNKCLHVAKRQQWVPREKKWDGWSKMIESSQKARIQSKRLPKGYKRSLRCV
jgi:hypothetical protein